MTRPCADSLAGGMRGIFVAAIGPGKTPGSVLRAEQQVPSEQQLPCSRVQGLGQP